MKESAEEEQINLSILIPSLLDSISQVQIFRTKWSLISTKLAAVERRLPDLSSGAAAANPLSATLLSSLSATCSSAATLAMLCHSPNPPSGKLKTQNDVDSISAELDSHINDLDVLIRTSVNSSSTPAVSPSRDRDRDSVRTESRDLMTRLQIGSTESRNSALDSLLGLLQEDDKNVLISVSQGIVPILVRLLDSSSSSEIKEKTVTAIAKISTVESSKHVLLAEGLVLLNNLLRVLESGSVFAKEKSCLTLQCLSQSKENAITMGSRGGISSLLEICQSGTPSSQALAAGVLRNLAVFVEIKENFIEENAVETLLSLCNSGTSMAQENVIGCLCNLVSDDDNLKVFVASHGGIESVKNFWDSSPSVHSLEACVRMVEQFASCPVISHMLVANGFLNRVVGVLNCWVLGVRIASANAVYDLGCNSKTRRELGEMGCVSILIRMLDGKAVEEKEAAAKALSMLLVCTRNRRIFRKEEKGIVNAVQLLDPLVQGLDKKYPVLVLLSFVHSKKCRKQMLAMNADVYLQKLVEGNVEGAKKLHDHLAHGRLWGVFHRP